MTMREQLDQQAYELAELKTQRQELRRLNGLLEKDCSRLKEEIRASNHENEHLSRQANRARGETRLLKEELRTAKHQAQIAKDSAKKAKAELERVKQSQANGAESQELLRKMTDAARQAGVEIDRLEEECQQALAERDAAEEGLGLSMEKIQTLQGEVERYRAQVDGLQKRVKDLEMVQAPLRDVRGNTSKTGKAKAKAPLVKSENVSPAVPAMRSSKRKAAVEASGAVAKKTRR